MASFLQGFLWTLFYTLLLSSSGWMHFRFNSHYVNHCNYTYFWGSNLKNCASHYAYCSGLLSLQPSSFQITARQRILSRMEASIPQNLSALNLFMHLILICCCFPHIFLLCRISKGCNIRLHFPDFYDEIWTCTWSFLPFPPRQTSLLVFRTFLYFSLWLYFSPVN